ncbi:hypothetical protein Afil01_53600 [Actinorhabdospora filicis]|uniref:Shikimate kinase n=1 Tax=Actinorhabdospora filicis TaxID=1785913 RepID=A0A9W6SQL5_9ACTN|nr:AAA family ATPase [Actinorhabdospora filicis]GLZ80553.1 hypothetical protein Afil01_53600 [Actinorhabdospora filicis]
MTRVLITGMSGTGKTTAVDELARRGHRAVETDTDEWSEWDGGDWIWREDRVGGLLAEHERTGVPLFVSGTKTNQVRFYPGADGPSFTHVVLFTAPLDVMRRRVDERSSNPYGKSEAEWAEIVGFTETVEPLLRRGADLVVDTRAPLDEVVARVLALLPPEGSSTRLSTGCPQDFPQKPGELSTTGGLSTGVGIGRLTPLAWGPVRSPQRGGLRAPTEKRCGADGETAATLVGDGRRAGFVCG